MEHSSIPEHQLDPTKKRIPLIGLGTAQYPYGASDNVKEAVLHAIKLGYRHFDSAAIYQSEPPLGEAIQEALRLGLIKSRDELFITSKLWISDAHGEAVLRALQRSLKNLQLEYLDLYLVHCPASLKGGGYELPFKREDLVPFDYGSVWKAMEKCQELGLTNYIGVSNFSRKKLEKLLSNATIPPVVNQVEMNPMWQQKELREFCGEKGVHITGYSPLGAIGTPWGSNRLIDCGVLQDIARGKGKSVAQICLRWVYEQGVSLVVKSFNETRMKENLDILDWKLSNNELAKISQIPQVKGFQGLELTSPDGPYKSFDELWDGEI